MLALERDTARQGYAQHSHPALTTSRFCQSQLSDVGFDQNPVQATYEDRTVIGIAAGSEARTQTSPYRSTTFQGTIRRDIDAAQLRWSHTWSHACDRATPGYCRLPSLLRVSSGDWRRSVLSSLHCRQDFSDIMGNCLCVAQSSLRVGLHCVRTLAYLCCN